MWMITDPTENRMIEQFETKEEAEARLAELIAADPIAERYRVDAPATDR